MTERFQASTVGSRTSPAQRLTSPPGRSPRHPAEAGGSNERRAPGPQGRAGTPGYRPRRGHGHAG